MARAERREHVPPQTGDRPHEPDSPLELTAPDWKQTLKRTAKEIKKDRVTLTAGGLGYYWFLALFPAIIALIGIVGIVGLPANTVQSLITGIETALPSGASDVISDAVRNASQGDSGASIAAIAGVAIALWSASAGMAALQTGLNIAYDVPQDRKFIAKRANAILLMVVAAVLGGIASALLVFGAPLGEWVKDLVPIGGSAFVWTWTAVRWVLTVLVITLLFSALFFLGPKRDSPKWQWVTPGGIVATVIWLAASAGFSFYVARFGSYSETYGALAGIVVLILWLYLTALAVLIGGELNAELERQSERRTRRL